MSVMFSWIAGVMFGLALASGAKEFAWASLIAAVTGFGLMLWERREGE